MNESIVDEDAFDAVFNHFGASPTATSVTRWEARPSYAVASEDHSLAAWRAGAARPERSVRTSPYLAEVASAALAGKSWVRLRRIEEPPGEYALWELESFRESQAAGERVLLAVEDSCRMPDVWLFDGEREADRIALVIHYDDDGAPVSYGRIDDPDSLRTVRNELSEVEGRSVPLNAYLAGQRR